MSHGAQGMPVAEAIAVRAPSVMLDRIAALERALIAKGFPAMSSFWRETVTRFYASGRRQLVLRVGRRGGKSSTLCRIAVLESLYGEHKIPPGDVGVVAVISVSRDEATQRLRTVKAILDALGVRYRPVEHGIEIEGRPVVFKTFVATIAGVSGPTCIAILADEVAKWRDADTGANPAKEVLASLRPTMATMPNAKLFLSSSPLGLTDAHAEAFEQGETPFQCVAYAPSWIANPSISEADTHALEPDQRIWQREYAAIGQAGALAAFDADDVASMIRLIRNGAEPLGRGALFIDSSSGRGDGWSFGIAQHIVEPCGETIHVEESVIRNGVHVMTAPIHGPDGKMVANPKYTPPAARLHLDSLGVFDGVFARTMSFADVVTHIASIARAYGMTRCYGDQYLAFSLTSEFARHGITFLELPWTAPAKVEAAATLRRLLREGTIVVEPGEEADRLKTELGQLQERFTPTGALTIVARRTGAGHADLATMALLIARAESEGAIAGSPMARGHGLTTYDPYTNEETELAS